MAPEGYDVATKHVGLIGRGNRAILALRGGDRADWLQGFVTNEVKGLRPGAGNYAFATDRMGRVVFDVNVLVRDDAVWLDLDRDRVAGARKHLDRYIITEDVAIEDLTGAVVRFGLLGPGAAELAQRIGLDGLSALARLQSLRIDVAGMEVIAVRHDFAGVLGAELIVTQPDAAEAVRAALWSAGEPLGIAEVSAEALDVLRIEAGIPWMGRDISEDTLPPETGQIDRGISYQKGCYLGQEIIERMRSRGGLARQLVGLKLDGATPPVPGAVVEVEGSATGNVTSVCMSPAVGATIGLGYVRPAHAAPGTTVTTRVDGAAVMGAVAELPFRTA